MDFAGYVAGTVNALCLGLALGEMRPKKESAKCA